MTPRENCAYQKDILEKDGSSSVIQIFWRQVSSSLVPMYRMLPFVEALTSLFAVLSLAAAEKTESTPGLFSPAEAAAAMLAREEDAIEGAVEGAASELAGAELIGLDLELCSAHRAWLV